MTIHEIDAACGELAKKTGIHVEWVKYHVKRMAGGPCHRCGGTGYRSGGVCFRCRGYGGKSTPQAVSAALLWVSENAVRVKKMGEERDLAAQARLMDKEVRVAEWKRTHEDLWDMVGRMPVSPFKDSVVKSIEDGTITIGQVQALSEIAQREVRQGAIAPPDGNYVTTRAKVHRADQYVQVGGSRVLRVMMVTEDGWRARYDAPVSESWGQGDVVEVSGKVVWSRGGFAVLDDVRRSPATWPADGMFSGW